MSVEGSRSLALAAALAGAAALGSELLWTRLLGVVLGHEQLAVLSVLAGLFLGVAVGAGLAHARADGLARPARVFAALQGAAAVYVLASPWLLSWCAHWLPAALGTSPRPALSLLVSALAMLPASAVFGASLPLLIAARRMRSRDDAEGLARFYALDTIGATLGVLAMVHLLLPRLGLTLAALVAAALSLAAAGLALIGAAGDEGPASQAPATTTTATTTATDDDDDDDDDDALLRERWIPHAVIGLSGLLGLGLEVVGVRVLAQIMSGTIYTFADLLAVWLLGTALGAAAYARLAARALRRSAAVLVGLLLGLGLIVAATASVATLAPALLELASGASWPRRQLAELLVAATVLGPATLVMGACFAHLLALIAAPAGVDGGPRPIGGALALNALAAAAAPSVFGLWILDAYSYAEAWALIAWGYLLLAVAVAWLCRTAPRRLALISIGGGLGILAASASAGSLVLVADEGEGWTLVERHETPLGVVAVSRSTRPPGSPERPLLRLRVDRHFRMGGAMSIGERRMGHLPLLLAGDRVSSALFLGLGTGATAGAATHYELDSLIAVELVAKVVDLLPHFEAINGGLAADPRAELVVADARRFLRADRRVHQLIVADLFHPARDGAGGLYTREHFEAARARLSDSGLFVQWLPLYQLDWRTVQIIARTFVEVFPEAHAMLALYNAQTPALGLIGSRRPVALRLVDLEWGLAEPARAPVYAELALADPRDLLAGYMLDGPGLVELAGDAPLNEDLHPRVELWAPRAELGPLTGADNLERLLALRRPWPEGFVVHDDPTRLATYREASARFGGALHRYLRGEIFLLRQTQAQLDDPREAGPLWSREIAAQYLDAYVHEPDFLPARPRLYAAAAADPKLASYLLPAMIRRTPQDQRAHRAWVAHLSSQGDRARHERALAALQALIDAEGRTER